MSQFKNSWQRQNFGKIVLTSLDSRGFEWHKRVLNLVGIVDVIIMFFQVFHVFRVVGSVKSMPSGYSLDAKFNFASNELFGSKFE